MFAFAVAVRVAHPERTVLLDVLREIHCCRFRHPQVGAVSGAGSGHRGQCQAVAARGCRVVDDARAGAFVSDAVILPCGFLVRCDRDRFAVLPAGGEMFAQLVGIGVEPDQPEFAQPVWKHLSPGLRR